MPEITPCQSNLLLNCIENFEIHTTQKLTLSFECDGCPNSFISTEELQIDFKQSEMVDIDYQDAVHKFWKTERILYDAVRPSEYFLTLAQETIEANDRLF